MEKLIKFCFMAVYGHEYADALVEVCAATPNSAIAAEKLLGLYEEPEIAPASTVSLEMGSQRAISPAEFISFNPFTEKVTGSYEQSKKRYFYFPKGWKQEEAQNSGLRFSELEARRNWPGQEVDYIYINTGEKENKTEEFSLSKWNEHGIWPIRPHEHEKDIFRDDSDLI
jgi:hypothetical protein